MVSDTSAIQDLLGARLEGVLDAYAPGWVGQRGVAYPAPKSKADLGSFQVQLRPPRRGKWFRFSSALGGGPVQLLSYLVTGTVDAYRETFSEARRFLGLAPQSEEDQKTAQEARRLAWEAERPKREAEAKIAAQEAARRQDSAFEIISHSRPVQGTLAEDYLVGRGLPRPSQGWGEQILFHRNCIYDRDQSFPALIGCAQDISGSAVACWRIFLNPLTAEKAPVDTPKKGLGIAKGAAVRFGGGGPKIAVAEGLETALAVGALTGWRRPVWAALSTSGMAGLEVPTEVDHVSIYPDGDLPIRRVAGSEEVEPDPCPPGQRAALALAERLSRLGVAHVINQPPRGGDFLDALQRMPA